MKTFLVVLSPEGAPPGFFEAVSERAADAGVVIQALFVVDSVWSRYSGSDWLSTGPSREQFDSYMRETLRGEGQSQTDALSLEAKRRGVVFSARVVEGDTADAALLLAGSAGVEAIIIPQSHPSLPAIGRKSRRPVLVYIPGEPLK